MSDAAAPDSSLFDKIVNLCKRRGIVFPSAEIYGGFRSTYDYGPVGVLMLRNVKDAWWRSMVQLRTDVVGLDASILSPPAIWEASGHLKNFTDPLVDCTSCNQRFRLDHLEQAEVERVTSHKKPCNRSHDKQYDTNDPRHLMRPLNQLDIFRFHVSDIGPE